MVSKWVMLGLLSMGGIGGWGMHFGASIVQAQDFEEEESEPVQQGAGVFVRDSAIAMEKYELCQRMVRLKEWNTAADVLQEIVEKYPDRVLQTNAQESTKNRQYASVSLWAQQQISKWPADGRAAYRARFEPAAKSMLDKAAPGDVAALQAIYGRYFATPSGLQAGLRLADLNFTQGEFGAAQWIVTNLLKWYPDPGPIKPALLFRQGLAAHMAGDVAAEDAAIDELGKAFADAQGIIGGKDTNYLQALNELKLVPVTVMRGDSPDSWPMPGGDLTGSRISTSTAVAGARMYSIAVDKNISQQIETMRLINSGNGQGQLQGRTDDATLAAGMLGVQPVADGGQLFFQTGRAIVAVGLEDGQPLPGWQKTWPGNGGRYVIPSAMVATERPCTLTVTSDRVLGILGGGYLATEGADMGARLVSLDRQTGSLQWKFKAMDLPESVGSARWLELRGTPQVMGDQVYVLLGGNRSGNAGNLIESHLVCLDLASGKYRWSAYLSSTNPPMNAYGVMDGMMSSDSTPSPMAISGGRVYVANNQGAIAAVDAYSGSILWLNTYPRMGSTVLDDDNVMRFGGNPQSIGYSTKARAINPVMLADGKLFAMPSDSSEVLVLDMNDGRILRTINRSWLHVQGGGRQAQANDPDVLVSVDGNRMIVAGDDSVLSFDWSIAAEGKPAAFWPQRLVRESQLSGRPFIAGDSLIIPTSNRLLTVSLAKGSITKTYPDSRSTATWAESEGPGNVIAVGDRVVVAGAQSISVYTDLENAVARLNEKISGNPADPDPQVQLAQILFNAGKVADALDHLERAIALDGGPATPMAAPSKLPAGRIFGIAMQIAQALSNAPSPSRQWVVRALDDAQAAARQDSEKVTALIGRVDYFNAQQQPAEAMAACQQLLADKNLRQVTFGRRGNPIQVGQWTRQVIAMLINKHGKEVYAPYADQAKAAMAQALAGRDIAGLMDVADQYPNASGAMEAMDHAAEIASAAGDHRQAVQILVRAQFLFAGQINKARHTARMAGQMLKVPAMVELAAGRLSYGARELGDPQLDDDLQLPDGQVLSKVTFTQALEKVHQFTASQAVSDSVVIGLPARQWATDSKNVNRLPFGQATTLLSRVNKVIPAQGPGVRPDRIIAWNSDGIIQVIEPASQRVVMTGPAMGEPIFAAWDGPALVIADASQVVKINPVGQTTWGRKIADLPAGGMATITTRIKLPGETMEPDQNGNSSPGVILERGPNGMLRRQIMALANVDEVSVLGENEFPASDEERIGESCIAGGRMIVSTTSGRVIALDLASGALQWQLQPREEGTCADLHANELFVVTRVFTSYSSQLVAINASDGTILQAMPIAAPEGLPVTMDLSSQGVAVCSTSGQLLAKDLFLPDDDYTWTTKGVFSSRVTDAREQNTTMLVDANRVVVLSDSGERIRIYSAETGRMMRYTPKGTRQEIDAILPTGGQGLSCLMQVDHGMLYLLNANGVTGFDLAQPDQSWSSTVDHPLSYRQMNIGRDFLVLDDTSTRGAQGDPDAAMINARVNLVRNINGRRVIVQPGGPPVMARRHRLAIFDRSLYNGRESGLLLYLSTISDDAGIVGMSVVPGGICYLNGNHEVKFLPAIPGVQ